MFNDTELSYTFRARTHGEAMWYTSAGRWDDAEQAAKAAAGYLGRIVAQGCAEAAVEMLQKWEIQTKL